MPRRTQIRAASSDDSGADEKQPPLPEESLPHSPAPNLEPPNPLSALLDLDPESASDEDIQGYVNAHVGGVMRDHEVRADYNVLFLYDTVGISRTDADRIYRAISEGPAGKPILLIMTSPGGDVASAYLIAKLCRENARDSFQVVVPRQAKSAATLNACGADVIHMGSLSELGPIDPQFGEIPALALRNSVEHLATLVQDYPQAAEMFASYLAKSIRVEALGYYERVGSQPYSTRFDCWTGCRMVPVHRFKLPIDSYTTTRIMAS